MINWLSGFFEVSTLQERLLVGAILILVALGALLVLSWNS